MGSGGHEPPRALLRQTGRIYQPTYTTAAEGACLYTRAGVPDPGWRRRSRMVSKTSTASSIAAYGQPAWNCQATHRATHESGMMIFEMPPISSEKSYGSRAG